MSYIVPRDKPKRCTRPKCRFMDRDTLDCRLQGKSWESFEEQYEHCPLIEVPPHGDLVDRTELLAEYDRQHKGPAGGARRIMEQATAVIEAEGSEK